MGEIADMMLDGTLDSETGEYLGDPCGYPRTAAQMQPDEWHGPSRSQKRNARRKRAKARLTPKTGAA